MEFITSVLPYVGSGTIVALIIGVLASGYIKASPDKAFIISGLRKDPKILIGKAGIKIPFLREKMN